MISASSWLKAFLAKMTHLASQNELLKKGVRKFAKKYHMPYFAEPKNKVS